MIHFFDMKLINELKIFGRYFIVVCTCPSPAPFLVHSHPLPSLGRGGGGGALKRWAGGGYVYTTAITPIRNPTIDALWNQDREKYHLRDKMCMVCGPDTKNQNKCLNLTFWYLTHILFVRNRQISDIAKRNIRKSLTISREYYYYPWASNILNNNLYFDSITDKVFCVLYLHPNDRLAISLNSHD